MCDFQIWSHILMNPTQYEQFYCSRDIQYTFKDHFIKTGVKILIDYSVGGNQTKLSLSLYALKETIYLSGIFISQDITRVSEEVQVISHHGGSFLFLLTRDSSLSDLRMPWQDPQSFPWHIAAIFSISGMKRKNLSPREHPGKLWKCSSSRFLSLKCSLPVYSERQVEEAQKLYKTM